LLNDYAKDLDVIDFFSVLIAINLGGIPAAFFAAFNLALPRFFGPVEPLNYTIKDSVSMFGAALFTPMWYSITGHSLLITMYMFTFHRYLHYIVLDLLFDQQSIGFDMSYCCIGLPTAYFMNTIIVKVIGEGMDQMMKKGIVVSKEIFLFTTLIIILIYAIGEYKKKRKEKVVKKSPVLAKKPKRKPEEFDIIDVPEPWEVPLMLLQSSPSDGLTMSDNEFRIGSTIVFFMFFVLRCFVVESLPSSLQFIIIIIFYLSMITVICEYIKWISQKAVRQGLPGILKGITLGIMVLMCVVFVV